MGSKKDIMAGGRGRWFQLVYANSGKRYESMVDKMDTAEFIRALRSGEISKSEVNGFLSRLVLDLSHTKEDLEYQIGKVKQERDLALQERDQLKSQMEARPQGSADDDADAERLSRESERLAEQSDRLARQSQELDNELAEYEEKLAKMNALKDDLAKGEEEQSDLTRKLSEMEDQNSKIREELENLTGLQEQLLNDLESTKQVREDLEEQRKQAEEENEKLSSHIENLKTAQEAHTLEAQNLEAQTLELQAAQEKAAQALAEAQEQTAQAHVQMQEAQAQAQEAQERAAQAQVEAQEAQERVEAEAKAKEEAEAKAKEEARARAEAEAKAKAEQEAQDEAEAKAREEVQGAFENINATAEEPFGTEASEEEPLPEGEVVNGPFYSKELMTTSGLDLLAMLQNMAAGAKDDGSAVQVSQTWEEESEEISSDPNRENGQIVKRIRKKTEVSVKYMNGDT
ncbi:MAG: hypothetical protein HUJ69_03965 [Lachnospiraceae bacterium]|nr:hypothetical protein [Lachnospiraceae bacterium]